MKTLVILSHPSIEESKINSAWIQEASKMESPPTIHNINEAYGDNPINVKAEQNLIAQHDAIVLQFPMYWFNVPPLLKKWLDDVLLPGFAYGPTEADRRMTGMPVGFAVSTGIKESDYSNHGRYKYSVLELLAPLHATTSYIGASAFEPYVFYGAEYNPSIESISASANGYAAYLEKLQNSSLTRFGGKQTPVTR